MALVESEVAFQKRCEELEEGLFEKFRQQDIASFSTLAFSWGSPQNQVGDSDLSELAAKIQGGEATVGNTANIRRLHFEACTFLMADMKTQVSAADPAGPVRKLPFVGKQNRLDSQKNASLVYRTVLSGSRRTSSSTRCTTCWSLMRLRTSIHRNVTHVNTKFSVKQNRKQNKFVLGNREHRSPQLQIA